MLATGQSVGLQDVQGGAASVRRKARDVDKSCCVRAGFGHVCRCTAERTGTKTVQHCKQLLLVASLANGHG